MNALCAASEATTAPISVLLIEDDLVDELATLRTVVREALPYRMTVARSIAEARAALAGAVFDVILADYQLTDGTSFGLMDAFGDHLVIFITGAWDETAAATALRLGVHDYLIKDTERKYLKLLHYRVETALRLRRVARQLRDSEARLQAILNHAPAAISAHDLSGRLILSNPHHAALNRSPPQASELGLSSAAAVESEETVTNASGAEHTYLTVRFPMSDGDGIVRAVGSISVDITVRKQAEQRIRHLAYFDALTGLPNRRLLLDRLQQALATSTRHGAHGAVFFIDLDHFKALNDTLGHDHGDLLLVEVARRLLACVRTEDTVARIGGDEFVIMVVGLSRDAREAAAQAAAVGEKILSTIGQPCQLLQHRHTVTPSVGVSLFQDREASLDAVIKRADTAMYQAKAAGHGAIRFFDPVMQVALDSRLALAADLRRAVGADQLCLHFQPQLEGPKGIVAAEALLRWRHPTHGELLPRDFLPLAEQDGMILAIGEWVVDAACAQLQQWADHPQTRELKIAINVGVHQFRYPGFAQMVARSLASHGAEPGLLRLEFCEAAVQDNPQRGLVCMNELRDIGVGLAIDDFGISYSSLSFLRRLPLQQIKISQGLVRSVTNDPHDAAVVKTILSIGRELGLSVIATGVETVPQRELLLGLGCVLWQGYLFGRPAPLIDFERLVTPVALDLH